MTHNLVWPYAFLDKEIGRKKGLEGRGSRIEMFQVSFFDRNDVHTEFKISQNIIVWKLEIYLSVM